MSSPYFLSALPLDWKHNISPLTIDADDQVPYRHLLYPLLSFVFVCYLCVIVLLDCFFQVLLSVVSRYNLERIVFVVSVAVVKDCCNHNRYVSHFNSI